MSDSGLKILVDGLRQGRQLDLDEQQTNALLAWLGGAARDPGAAGLRDALGSAGDDEALRAAAFDQLDFSLFDGDRLLLDAAGLDAERDDRDRRRRFRLLLSVFHPDRYPARSEWLTSRLQIVNRSYADFKAGRLDDSTLQGQSPPDIQTDRKPRAQPPAWQGITPNWTMTERLRARLGRDRFLGHKIIAVLAVIIALPIISILLDSNSGDIMGQLPDQHRPLEERWIGEDLDLAIDHWPVVSLDPQWMVMGQTEPDPPALETVIEEPLFVRSDNPRWLAQASVARMIELPAEDAIEVLVETEEPQPITGQEQMDIRPVVPEPADSSVAMASRVEELAETDTAPIPSEPASVDKVDDVAVEVAETVPEKQEVEPEIAEPVPAAVVQVERRAAISSGSLSLGPLVNNQAGSLLRDYWASVESGDVDGVLNVLARRPRENDNEGRGWFERQYDELFRSSSQRALHMRIINAQRDGNDWVIDVQYQLELARTGSTEVERLEREVRYLMSPDPFRLRIISVEY